MQPENNVCCVFFPGGGGVLIGGAPLSGNVLSPEFFSHDDEKDNGETIPTRNAALLALFKPLAATTHAQRGTPPLQLFPGRVECV